VFDTTSHFHPSLIFVGKANEPTVKVAALTANVRLGLKSSVVTNTQAYCGTKLIKVVQVVIKTSETRLFYLLNGRHDTQHNNTRHNDTQHKRLISDISISDIQHK
jgi:hypothetical protein